MILMREGHGVMIYKVIKFIFYLDYLDQIIKFYFLWWC